MSAQRLTYGVTEPQAKRDESGRSDPAAGKDSTAAPWRTVEGDLPRPAPTADPDRYAHMFKALGNPHRLQLYLQLAEPGPDGCIQEITVGDLGDGLDIARSTLSHHLRELQAGGLIRTRRHGRSILCRIEPESLLLLSSLFSV